MFSKEDLENIDNERVKSIIEDLLKSNKYDKLSCTSDTIWLDNFLMSKENNSIIDSIYDLDFKLNKYAIMEILKEVSNYMIRNRLFV